MYSEKFLIGSNEVDPFLDLSIPSLFRLLQAVATTGVASIGAGKEETTDKGYLWVLTRMRVEISRMPRYMDQIELTTYPGEQIGCFYGRHFFAKDEAGKTLFRVSSTWALLHEADHKPVMRSPFPHPLTPEKDPLELPRPEKLLPFEGASLKEKRKVTYSMCDLNGHLNNTRYLELIVDAKGSSFYKEYTPKSIVLNFEKEIREGEEVEVFVEETKQGEIGLIGKVDSEERFLAKLEFAPKERR